MAGVRGLIGMTSDAVLRWVRALTLPSVLFFSALAGHAAGGGVATRPLDMTFPDKA